MEFARKFKLVPTEEVSHKSGLDDEMRKILKRKLDAHTKWTLYQQTLQKYLKNPKNDILEDLPSQYKDRASKLLDTMHNDLAWESNGAVTVKDKVIPHSHIADLTEAALNPGKARPLGWKEFSAVLPENIKTEDVQWEEWPPKKVKKERKTQERARSRTPRPRRAKR